MKNRYVMALSHVKGHVNGGRDDITVDGSLIITSEPGFCDYGGQKPMNKPWGNHKSFGFLGRNYLVLFSF